jgi:hypothetical protein
MLRPFLLIGVGGSGGKTLRVIRDNLEWQLRQAGWPAEEGFPKAWQFLQLDVASAPDGDDPDLPPQLPAGSFLGMVNSGLTYSAMDTTLSHSLPPTHQLESLGGWRPDPNKVQVAITRGAGQYRALGRVVALTRLDEIKRRVDRAVDAITDVDVARQLGRLTTMLGQGQPRPDHPEPAAIVVSSIAGGSGAGAVLEVCDIIRAAGRTWLDESVGILYAPDVFDEIPEAVRRGVRPNALATLSELVAGSWSFDGRDGGITDGSARLYQARGVETAAINRLGPRYPVLVGARNADVAYGSQNEIYRGMGRAISEWMTKSHLQDSMAAYFSGNRQATATTMTDRLGLKLRHHETPFTALGFARMTLGREWFGRYASQYLARAAAERVVSMHLAGRPSDDRRTDDELIEELTDQAWPAFLAASGLDERGVDSNDVVDALRPVNRKTIGRAWIERVLQSIKTGDIPSDGLPVTVWQNRIEQALREQGPILRDELRSERLAQARRWVEDVQVTLPQHAMRSLATHGGPVTQQLLRRLSSELETIVRELPEERAQHVQKSSRAALDIRAILSKDGKGRLPQGSSVLEKAVSRAAASIGFEAEGDLFLLVEQLLRDLRSGLLEPLNRAVSHGVDGLRSDTRRHGGHPSVIEYWPTGDHVPARLHPARNEFLLDDVQQFPTTMRDLLRRDAGRDVAGDAEVEVIKAVITEMDLPDASATREGLGSVGRTRTWVPNVPDLHETMSSPAPAVFSLNIRAEDLLTRAEDWINSDQRQFGRYLAQSLADHLSDPNISPADKSARLQRFAGQLKAAIGRARPLVHIDREVLSIVHDKADAQTTLVIDQIPLRAGSDAATKAKEVLDTSGASVREVGDLFTDLAGQTISVFGILAEPYEPTVFTSLMKPMANEWAEVRLSDDSRQTFWTWRRSRTLPEFVPAAPAVRRAIVRGWFTALLLGQVKGHDTPQSNGVAVWGPSLTGGTGGWHSMPHPLLRPFGSPAEAPAAVLESLPLALLEVYSMRSLDPLKAFHRLRDLGSAGHLQGMETYETLNDELSLWVREGTVDHSAPMPDTRAGSPDETAEMRRKRVVERLGGLRQAYERRFADLARRGALAAVPRDFELQHDILEALDDLVDAVESSADSDRRIFT